MFRLIRILIVAALLAGIYFYLQQTSFITTTWQRAQVGDGLSLAFPKQARHHSRQVYNATFGKTRLDIYDRLQDNEAFICLTIRPQQYPLRSKTLSTIIEPIRQLNDTADTEMTLKKQFTYLGYPAYEYHATDKQGKTLWVRLIKTDGAILSLIYVVDGQSISRRMAENFFTSLKF